MMDDYEGRYSRQLILEGIGPEGQERLLRSKVLVVGLGGLGSPVALYLTGAGVGTIGLCDPDTVSITNLQRQTLYVENMVGLPKPDCARIHLHALSRHTHFELYPQGLTAENAREIISGYDMVMDCTDNFRTRFIINDECRRAGIPWVFGAIGEFTGQIGLMLPDTPPLEALYGSDPAARRDLENLPPAAGGVLGASPGVVGALQAAEALKFLAGMPPALAGKVLCVDLCSMSTNIINL